MTADDDQRRFARGLVRGWHDKGMHRSLRRDFIVAGFAQFPEVGVQVGRILSREAALQHIQVCRAAEEETSAGG